VSLPPETVPTPEARATSTPPSRRGGGMMRSSAIFSGLTLISRGAGFARDVVIAAA
jgi:putative peptidoglycan lipid II flippase